MSEEHDGTMSFDEAYDYAMKQEEENKIHVVQVKITKKFRDRLVEDAEKHFRSTGMHIKSIVTNYLDMRKPHIDERDKGERYKLQDFEDMENL